MGSGSESEEDKNDTQTNYSFTAQDPNKVRALFHKVKGVLYENPIIQIGYKYQVEQGYRVRVGLYYGNRNKKLGLKDVKAVLPKDGYMDYKVEPEVLTISPQKQLQQTYIFESKKPFATSPTITLNFQFNGEAHSLALSFPILPFHFVTANPMEPTQFLPSWKGIGNEVQKQLKLASVDIQKLHTDFSDNLHLTVLPGVDTNPNNICATGIFNNRNNVKMPCYIRLETRPNINVVRLTIRSGHESLSSALFRSLQLFLNAEK